LLKRICLTVCLISSAMGQVKQLTAREYYEELYKVGGLDNFVDQYVCFREDDRPVFFLMSNSKAFKEFLSTDDGMKSLSSDMRKALEKGFLIVRLYNKGIAHEREFFDPDNHGGWVEEYTGGPSAPSKHLTIRLDVNWDTLRYTRSVSTTGMAKSDAESGKCEPVKGDITQHGSPETQKSK
jgi:hypothetical protein